MIAMSDTESIRSVHAGLEALTDGFFMLDPEWRVVYWNAAAGRLLGVSREQAIGRALWDVLPRVEGSIADERLRAAMNGKESAEFVVPHAPGCRSGYYSVRAAPLEEGGIAVHFRDVTDETKLAERYAQLLESIHDGFVAVDADGRISYVNQIARRMLRLSESQPLGMPVWTLIPEELTEIEASLRATMEDARPRHLRRISPEGPLFRDVVFDLRIQPLPGGGVSLLFRDVTHRVQREKDLARYAAEAEEANHAKGRFFAAVSHELRTPLNAIVGYTHLLTTNTYGELPPAASRAASRTSVCAEHLAHLIDDLLLMTTAEIDRLPVTPTPVSLGSYLPPALEPIRHQAEAKGLVFGIQVAEDVPAVDTDPDRLRQLLHALLSNAVKFTNRGRVSVDVSALALPPQQGETGDAPAPDGVRIRIIDTGPGIPGEARERIFEAFEQLGDTARSDSLRRGTGLGLTVARRLAALLHGNLSLEQSDASGSVFRLDLPLRVTG
jgi:PAS domain S-box-containing protein